MSHWYDVPSIRDKGGLVKGGLSLLAATAKLTADIAPVAKVLGVAAKKAPVLGAVVTGATVAYEVGSKLADGNTKGAFGAAVSGGAEIGGSFIGFGAGDALREVAREGTLAIGGKDYDSEKSGLRQMAEKGIGLASKYSGASKRQAQQPAAPKKDDVMTVKPLFKTEPGAIPNC